MTKQRAYFCIDMKSFFASVECAERGLNPFETNLVVADETRGTGAICLAISPKMKALGVKNRCRIFEIPKNIKYITAKPRMKKYIEYCADIYDIYLQYISPDDIHVYSIDESFIDATDYLKIYNLSPKEFATKLVNEIALKTHIPATVGIGTNLYLAKIALDITAKKVHDHMGMLDEESFRKTLWNHTPITDFWQIASGTARRLLKHGIYDMEGIAKADEKLLYKLFGINAELLIDHAWGRESCTMKDIKAYKSKSKSVSNSQILFEDYSYEKAEIVLKEMILNGSQELKRRKLVTNNVGIYIGYSKDLYPPTGGSLKTSCLTSCNSILQKYALRIFEETTNPFVPIRRIGISFGNVVDESCEGYDLFADMYQIEKENKVEESVLKIKDKFGKNAMIRGLDLIDGATQIKRNTLVGGHNGE